MGWGLCAIREFAQFSVGDHVIIVIPADHKNDTKYSILQRSQFRNRFVNAVGTLVHEGTTAYRASDSSHRNYAENHVSTHHGIERNQKEFIEIRCSIERYPNRDNYLQDVIPLNELTRQIKQRGGIYLAMLDYSTIVMANKSNVLQLLWTEVPFIQVWTNFRRGDHRPPFLIQHDRGTPEYCREIAFHYNNYKDDNQRLRELLLVLERKKNEALTQSHTAFERQASAKLSATESIVRSFNAAQLKGEMEDDRLPQFAADADRAYYNALLHHYKNFTSNTPLLGDETNRDVQQDQVAFSDAFYFLAFDAVRKAIARACTGDIPKQCQKAIHVGPLLLLSDARAGQPSYASLGYDCDDCSPLSRSR